MRLRWLWLIGLLLWSRSAHAERFAVIIGNNVGHAHEQPLQFAERDAARIADALTSVGGVRPDQLILAQGASATNVRGAMIGMNERIRARPDPASVLIVYYSGHGDANALHLGHSSLPIQELEGLVRGSAAQLRILIVDACRAGALVRGKGGRPAPALRLDASPAGDGVVVLTATAAGEDAHESPSLEGSFFTHHLHSGLLGAADADADGRVTITEAYDYAYANTLRDSSATIAGPQHPSYRYDLRGQGDVALTEVRNASERALLLVPPGLTVLIMRGSATGAVLAEARSADDKPASLWLPPGRIFLRVRTANALYEQHVTLRAGQRLPVSVDTMERIDFARLARKGGSHRPSLTGLGLSVLSRRGLSDAGASCNGAAGYAVFVRRAFSLASRLGACREAFDQNGQHLATTEALLGVSLNMHRDLSPSWSVLIGPELSASYLRQAISGPTPTKGARNVFGGAITVQGGVEFALGAYALTARALAQTYILELQNPGARSPQVSAVFAWGATLGVTRYLR